MDNSHSHSNSISNRYSNSKSVLSLSILLGACALSPSTTIAFLHFPPHRTSRRILRNNSHTKPQTQTQTPSQLAFYPSDETTFAERLKRVQDVWGGVKQEGIGKFFSDEFNAADKIIKGSADSSETGVVGKGGLGVVDAGKELASEMLDVRQAFDELRAVKIIEEAAEDVIRTGVSIEQDLVKVVENVVSSVKEAEEAVQSVIAAVASKEGLAPVAKVELIEKLEAKAQGIDSSIKVADSVAATAQQIAATDAQVLSRLAHTGERLASALDATAVLARRYPGTGAAAAAVADVVDHTSVIVKETFASAAGLAAAVGRTVATDADAVASLDARAAGAGAAVRAAAGALRASEADGASALVAALTQDARDILADTDVTERLVAAMAQDAAADGAALEALARSSSDVCALMEAVQGAVKAAADVVDAADEATANRVTGAVGKIEEVARGVEGSLEELEKARGKCEESNVKALLENMEEAKKVPSLESVEAAAAEEEGAAKIRVGDGGEKEQHMVEVKEVESPPPEIEHAKMESVARHAPPGEDAIREATSGDTLFERDAFGGETGRELPDTTTTITGAHHFDGESVSDVALITVGDTSHAIDMATHSISSDHLAEAAATTGDPAGFHMLLTNLGSVASDVGSSVLPSSDVAHDVVTSTVETLAEAAAAVSSLLS